MAHAGSDPAQETLVGVASDEHPDGAVVDLADHGPWPLRPDRVVRIRYERDTRAVLWLRVTGPFTTGAPRLRYVQLPEPGAAPPAHVLVAFEAEPGLDGAVHDAEGHRRLGVPGDQQVGAIRWFPETGLIHQIYVNPAQRRRRIGTTLVMAAAAVRVLNGWPALHADGRRTDLGEAFSLAGPTQWRHRVQVRSEVMPPMTPGG